jgi:hypothetical protein
MTEPRELRLDTELSLDEAIERVRDQVRASQPRLVMIGRRSRLRAKLDGHAVRFHLHRGRLTFSAFEGALSADARGAVLEGRFESPEIDQGVVWCGMLSSLMVLAGLALALFAWEGLRTLAALGALVGFAALFVLWGRLLQRNVPIDIELLTREIELLFDSSREPGPAPQTSAARGEPEGPGALRPR